MVRYEYIVLKSFSISTDQHGKEQISDFHDDTRYGPEFKKGSLYVDYIIPSEKVTECLLTQKLVDKKFIKLIKTIE